MVVFGDESAYKEKLGAVKYGWVLAVLPVERRNNEELGEVGALIYVGADQPIYLVPTSFFHPTEEQLAGLSNTQRRKRSYNFEEGTPVEFGVDEDDRVLWITQVNHGECPITAEGAWGQRKLYLQSLIVRAPDETSFFVWDDEMRPYVDVCQLRELKANVAYYIYFRIDLSYGNDALLTEQASRLKLDDFKPTFRIKFDEFREQDTSRKGKKLVKDAPWNTPHAPQLAAAPPPQLAAAPPPQLATPNAAGGSTSLYVSNLKNTGQEELLHNFRPLGAIGANIHQKQPFGFVHFPDAASATRARERMDGELLTTGDLITVEDSHAAYNEAGRIVPTAAARGENSARGHTFESVMRRQPRDSRNEVTTIHVANLPCGVPESALRARFCQYGTIQRLAIRVVHNARDGSFAEAFIRYGSATDAAKAIVDSARRSYSVYWANENSH